MKSLSNCFSLNGSKVIYGWLMTNRSKLPVSEDFQKDRSFIGLPFHCNSLQELSEYEFVQYFVVMSVKLETKFVSFGSFDSLIEYLVDLDNCSYAFASAIIKINGQFRSVTIDKLLPHKISTTDLL